MALYTSAGERGHVAAWENIAAMQALGHGAPGGVPNPDAARYIRDTLLPALRKAAANAAAAAAQPQGATAAATSSDGDGAGCGKPTCCGGGGCGSGAGKAVVT